MIFKGYRTIVYLHVSTSMYILKFWQYYNWLLRCTCGHCEVMSTSRECICCYEYKEVLAIKNEHDGLKCVTDHPDFSAVCLNISNLKIAYKWYRQRYGERQEQGNEYVFNLFLSKEESISVCLTYIEMLNLIIMVYFIILILCNCWVLRHVIVFSQT